MNPFVNLIHTVITLYTYVVIAAVVMSWLLAFNVVNIHNSVVRQVTFVLGQLTEPALAPIRRYMPNLGGLDISPLVLLLGLYFLDNLVFWLFQL